MTNKDKLHPRILSFVDEHPHLFETMDAESINLSGFSDKERAEFNILISSIKKNNNEW